MKAVVAALAAAAVGYLGPAVTAERGIQLAVTPSRFALAPATMRVQVRVAPIQTDREVVVETDGPDFYRRSEWTIEGAAAPRLYEPIEYRDLPEGTYQIRATVGPREHVRAVAVAEVTVR
jgi:hypothetical protein